MSPAIGSTVTEAPASIVLTFGEDVKALGSTVVVLDPAGSAVQTGDAVAAGVTLTQPLVPLTLAGDYHVNFRVVSADGHVVTGSEVFRFEPAEATPALLTASPEVSPVKQTNTSVGIYITGLLIGLAALATVGVLRARRH